MSRRLCLLILSLYTCCEIVTTQESSLSGSEVLSQHTDACMRKMASRMMRTVKFDKPGGADNLYIGQVPVPELREKEVLIEVYSSAINRADTLQRQGRYPPPKGESDILGLEATGKINQKGPGCSDKWKIGDRVMALLAGGGNAEYVACHEDILMSVPATMKFTEAAAIPEVWLTSYQLLHTIGQVKKGDNVLIHAGGSGIGTTATQLTVLAGAKPIVTAGSKEKIEKAISLGAVTGFNYKEGDFTQKVLDVTNGAGVNLILDCIGESYYEQNVNSIAMEGRWVVYGLLGGGNVNGDLLSKLLRKRITITGTTLRARSIEYKRDLVNSFTENVLPLFTSGKVKPIVDKTFPLEQISDAHKYMESNQNIGKILLHVRDE